MPTPEDRGLSLYQLRHSAATHLGRQSAGATVIMAKTHYRSIRAVARSTRPAVVTEVTALPGPPDRRADAAKTSVKPVVPPASKEFPCPKQ